MRSPFARTRAAAVFTLSGISTTSRCTRRETSSTRAGRLLNSRKERKSNQTAATAGTAGTCTNAPRTALTAVLHSDAVVRWRGSDGDYIHVRMRRDGRGRADVEDGRHGIVRDRRAVSFYSDGRAERFILATDRRPRGIRSAWRGLHWAVHDPPCRRRSSG